MNQIKILHFNFCSKELIEIFNQSLDNDDEGIVLKKYDSVYKPNVRERSGCYKIKAEVKKCLC